MKKVLAILMTLVLVVGCFAACGKNPSDDGSAAKTYKIGICNYVDDASLNQIVDNIKAQLEAKGKENNVKFDIKYDNCNADANVMSQIIANFEAEKVDLMVGVATPVAVAMQAATEDNNIPVVFAAVSDPVSAGLVKTLEAPGANITGSSDYLDTTSIFNLIFAANPEAKKIGLLYDMSQDSSTTPIADAKKYLEAKGVAYVEKTGSTVDEVTLAAQALIAEGVDAVFTPTDNSIMKAELAIYELFAEAKIPQYTGADSFALNGAFLGYGVDYINLGKETGNMVADILINGKNPGEVAVLTFDNGTATINTETCAAIGYDIDDITAKFSPLCLEVKTITTAESFDDLEK